MSNRIFNFTRRHRLILFVVAISSVGVELLIISMPRLRRLSAAAMMMRAIRADDRDLEGSLLLISAIDRVKTFQAEDMAVARLVPLVDVNDARVRIRARFCLMHLETASPGAIDALVAAYRNRRAHPVIRAEAAGLLTLLAPQSAEECGAAAFERKYLALMRERDQHLFRGDEYERRLRDLLP